MLFQNMRFPLMILGLSFCFLLGCKDKNPGPDMGGTDGKQIALLVDEINEAAGDRQKVKALFKTGTPLPDAQKLTEYNFSIVGKPSVFGSSATAKVRIDNSSKGQKMTELEWSFEKEGETWKITNAPLP